MGYEILVLVIAISVCNWMILKMVYWSKIKSLQNLSLGDTFNIENSPLHINNKEIIRKIYIMSLGAFILLFALKTGFYYLWNLLASEPVWKVEIHLWPLIEFGLYGYLFIQAFVLFVQVFALIEASYFSKSPFLLQIEDILKGSELLPFINIYKKELPTVVYKTVKEFDSIERFVLELPKTKDLLSLVSDKEKLDKHQPSPRKEELLADIEHRISEKKQEFRSLYDDFYIAIGISNPLHQEEEEAKKIEVRLFQEGLPVIK